MVNVSNRGALCLWHSHNLILERERTKNGGKKCFFFSFFGVKRIFFYIYLFC